MGKTPRHAGTVRQGWNQARHLGPHSASGRENTVRRQPIFRWAQLLLDSGWRGRYYTESAM